MDQQTKFDIKVLIEVVRDVAWDENDAMEAAARLEKLLEAKQPAPEESESQ